MPDPAAAAQEEFRKALWYLAQADRELRRTLNVGNQQGPGGTQRQLLEQAVDHLEALAGEVGAAQLLGPRAAAPAHCSLCALCGDALGAAAPAVPTEAHFLEAHFLPCLSARRAWIATIREARWE